MSSVDLFDFPAFKQECRGGMRECADKLMSEAAEVFGEVRMYCSLHRSLSGLGGVHRECIAEEIADVMQVCRNVCEVCEITPGMMAAAMVGCMDKNRRRDGGRYE